MPVKFSSAHIFFAKALLFVVALAACSATAIASPKPDGVTRSLHGVETPNATDISLSVKQHVTSNTTNEDDTSGREERLFSSTYSEIVSRVKEGLQKMEFKRLKKNLELLKRQLPEQQLHDDLATRQQIESKAQRIEHQLQNLMPKVSASLLKRLERLDGINKNADKVFGSQPILTWFQTLEKSTPASLDAAYREKLAAFSRDYSLRDEAELSMFLLRGGKATRKGIDDEQVSFEQSMKKGKGEAIAEELMKFQDREWITQGKTSESMFKFFKLDRLKAKDLFESPITERWIHFVISRETNGLEKIYGVLSKQYGADKLAKALLNVPPTIDWYSYVPSLLDLQLEKWFKARKPSDFVRKVLMTDGSSTPFSQQVYIRAWLDYNRLLELDDIKILTHFKDSFGEETVQKVLNVKESYSPLGPWIKAFQAAITAEKNSGTITHR